MWGFLKLFWYDGAGFCNSYAANSVYIQTGKSREITIVGRIRCCLLIFSSVTMRMVEMNPHRYNPGFASLDVYNVCCVESCAMVPEYFYHGFARVHEICTVYVFPRAAPSGIHKTALRVQIPYALANHGTTIS